MDVLETCENGFGFAILEGFQENSIAVVAIYHEEVVMALT